MNKSYLLYGLGKSNLAVKKFFDKNNIHYFVYTDCDDYESLNINKNYIVVKSPGVKNDASFLRFLIKNNYQIISDIELYYLFFPNNFYIGITGTLGKTTTTLLINHILGSYFNDVNICGNIGIPIFEIGDKTNAYIIIELSSFQLEYCFSFKPRIMIFLNIYNHHLDYHKSFENYLTAKLKPTEIMDENDILIINKTLIPHMRDRKIKSKIIAFSLDDKLSFLNVEDVEFLKYKHNMENLIPVLILCRYFNILDEFILNKLKTFVVPKYRMEKIFDEKNLIIINDSKSTCLKSSIEALNNCLTIYENHKITLILGGKLNVEEIINYQEDIINCENVDILLFGENKDLLFKITNGTKYDTLNDIIKNLKINNQTKTLILFSPGAQSFDQFNSFEERGKLFEELILEKFKS